MCDAFLDRFAFDSPVSPSVGSGGVSLFNLRGESDGEGGGGRKPENAMGSLSPHKSEKPQMSEMTKRRCGDGGRRENRMGGSRRLARQTTSHD